jgi:hypothetical protein
MAGSRRWSRNMLIFFSGGIERRLQRSELETTTRRRRRRKMLVFFQRGPRDRAQVCLLVTRTAAAILWRFSASSLSVRSEIIFVEHGLAGRNRSQPNLVLLILWSISISSTKCSSQRSIATSYSGVLIHLFEVLCISLFFFLRIHLHLCLPSTNLYFLK